MIWDKERECMSRGKLDELQLDRLKWTVARTYDRVPFYKKKMDDAGVKPSDINSLADVRKLPFTVKDDMRDNYPYGLFAVPLKRSNFSFIVAPAAIRLNAFQSGLYPIPILSTGKLLSNVQRLGPNNSMQGSM